MFVVWRDAKYLFIKLCNNCIFIATYNLCAVKIQIVIFINCKYPAKQHKSIMVTCIFIIVIKQFITICIFFILYILFEHSILTK